MAGGRVARSALLASGLVSAEADPFNLASSPIAWQAHSFNDLRTWRQLPAKHLGQLLSVKVDPHAVDPDGTFKLTHDNPVEGVAYNTTDDVLFAAEGLLAEWPALSLRVALCFKGEFNDGSKLDPCDGSDASAFWLTAVDRFFEMAEGTRDKFPERLEFVLDGVAKPYQCLESRWGSWVSTWIPRDHSPAAAYTSNVKALGFDRYQIFNLHDVEAEWETFGLQHFGKFGAGSYPLQLWEPDEQAKIQYFSRRLLSTWRVASPDVELDFAINIDPKMWEVFSAAETGRAWNAALPLAGTRSSPRLFRLASGDLLALNVAGSNASWDLFRPEATFGTLSTLASGILPLDSSVSAACLSADDSLHVVAGGERVMFVLTSENVLEEAARVPAPSALALQPLSADGSMIAALLQSPAVDSMTSFEIRALTSDWDGLMLWALPPFASAASSSADFVTMPDGTFMVAASNGSHAFVVSSFGGGWELVGTGKKLSLALLDRSGSGEPVVAMVADGGFCAVNHKHNTDATVKVCDRAAVPCAAALDYTIGTASQWVELAAGASGPAGPCSSLLRGTYDFGGAPSAVLAELGNGAVALLALHEGPGDDVETCDCGTPVPRPGQLVLDGFPLRVDSGSSTMVV